MSLGRPSLRGAVKATDAVLPSLASLRIDSDREDASPSADALRGRVDLGPSGKRAAQNEEDRRANDRVNVNLIVQARLEEDRFVKTRREIMEPTPIH